MGRNREAKQSLGGGWESWLVPWTGAGKDMASLDKVIRELATEHRANQKQVNNLRPFLTLLERAAELGTDPRVVEQSGFVTLQRLGEIYAEDVAQATAAQNVGTVQAQARSAGPDPPPTESEEPLDTAPIVPAASNGATGSSLAKHHDRLSRLPVCCICLQPCRVPVVTKCVHMACKECMLHWLSAAPVMANQMASTREAACPLCRQPFSSEELIRIVPPTPGQLQKCTAAKRKHPFLVTPPPSDATPRYTVCCTKQVFQALLSKIAGIRDSAYPALPAAFLSHMRSACWQPQPRTDSSEAADRAEVPVYGAKVAALLHDLRQLWEPTTAGVPGASSSSSMSTPSPGMFAKRRKAVVFSAKKQMILHLHHVLTEEGISHVKMVRGDVQATLRAAIGKFNDSSDQGASVFLLHASTAAAGLTLTAAHHVFLMEPFQSRGDELQALNRCHRIGQQQEVHCVTYFARNSVEERLLSYRKYEVGDGDSGRGGEELALMDNGNNGTLRSWSSSKVKYVFGLADEDQQPTP